MVGAHCCHHWSTKISIWVRLRIAAQFFELPFTWFGTGCGDAIQKPPRVPATSLAGWFTKSWTMLDPLHLSMLILPRIVGMLNLDRAPKSLQHCTASCAWSTKFWKFLYRFLAASVAKKSLVGKIHGKLRKQNIYEPLLNSFLWLRIHFIEIHICVAFYRLWTVLGFRWSHQTGNAETDAGGPPPRLKLCSSGGKRSWH